jgi:hypothetical protein
VFAKSGKLEHAMYRTSYLCSTLAFAVAAVATAGVVEIPILNHSFESPPQSLCGFGAASEDWLSGSVWHCGTEGECFYDAFPGGPTDGLQVGFTNSTAPIVQETSEALVANETYTLRVDIGMRNDFWHMEDYAVRLYAGDMLLAEDPGLLSPEPGTWETSVVFFETPANHAAIGQPLSIHLVLTAGIQGDFDNVRLTKGETGTPTLPGDLNGDGVVNAADLAMLLGSWGPCRNCSNCIADLNDDCSVNAADLAVLLGNWTI